MNFVKQRIKSKSRPFGRLLLYVESDKMNF